jgi:glycerol-3-phosphate acyltransferase PlsY
MTSPLTVHLSATSTAWPQSWPVVVLLGTVAYAIGTFPSASLVAARHGIEITNSGSGNPGASNVARTLGWRAGVAVFGLDAVKGAIATGLGLWLLGRPGAYLLGTFAILGHIFPVTRAARGGKGVATAAGVLVVVHPILATIVVALWWVVTRLTRTAALGSILAVLAVPIGMVMLGIGWSELAATLGIAALIVSRHAGNIARLLRREEHRVDRPAPV